jgi:hypothetical protein
MICLRSSGSWGFLACRKAHALVGTVTERLVLARATAAQGNHFLASGNGEWFAIGIHHLHGSWKDERTVISATHNDWIRHNKNSFSIVATATQSA